MVSLAVDAANPVAVSAFQESLDRARATEQPTVSPQLDRASSFAASSSEQSQLDSSASGRKTNWGDFSNAYCNGRWDPLRIPNPPDFEQPAPSPRHAMKGMKGLKGEGASSAPTVTTHYRPQTAPYLVSHSGPSSIATDKAPTPPGRLRSYELENLPHRRQKPAKIALPAYRVAAATVRIASSNLPESMFAPLSVPSPERELLDPLASFMSPPSSNKSSANSDPGPPAWNRSMSNILPTGTPAHDSLPPIQGSPVTTPSSETAFLDLCCGNKFASTAGEPPLPSKTALKGGAIADLKVNIPPASAPLPPIQPIKAVEDDYFSGAPILPVLEEPETPVPVPETYDYPLIHHAHELQSFYEKYGFLPAPMPPREAERRKALYNFNILHTAGDINFDRIVHMVKLVFNTRIVFLSLIDSDQQWYKSQTGFGGTFSPRVTGFCGHTLLVDSDEPFVILDTHLDWRFAKNPHVLGPPHVRFYAGTPLRTSDGLNLGSLCLVDDRPRTEFTPRSRHILKEFAAIVMREMELWRDKVRPPGDQC